MGRFFGWLHSFMQGRYGFDEYGQALTIRVVILWIAAIILNLFTNLFGLPAYLLSQLINLIGFCFLIYFVFRFLSRNADKRRQENARYLERKRKRKGRQDENRRDAHEREERKGYKYLKCAFCGQEMRVPKGKGKIAVKCPSCGEKTIFKS